MSLQTTSCSLCDAPSSRYRCPRCSICTCSLVCIRAHKDSSGCDGVREKVAFVARKEFSNLNLLSDFRYLEDVERQVESATRDVVKDRHNLPVHARKLLGAARKQGVHLKVLPYPLSRRVNNNSYFHIKLDEIEWQVEWMFPQVKAKRDNKIMANTTLSDALDLVIVSPTSSEVADRHILIEYVHQRHEIRLFMKIEGRRADSQRYYELMLEKSLKENLTGKSIIEYPTIIVAYGTECENYNLTD